VKSTAIIMKALPYVSSDGEYFFFNSSRVSVLNTKPIPGGPGNVYWLDAKIIEELKKVLNNE